MADSEPRGGPAAYADDREAILLVARPTDAGATAYCRGHLATESADESTPIVVLTDRPGDGARRCSHSLGRPGVVLAVGDSTRSAAAEPTTPIAPSSPPETVTATGDLAAVGRTVDGYLTTWTAAGHRPVVCVDSISGLVEHASVGACYRFLYVLLRRVEGTDGAAHAHVTPYVHEDEILRTFYQLFDRVVSFRDGDSPYG